MPYTYRTLVIAAFVGFIAFWVHPLFPGMKPRSADVEIYANYSDVQRFLKSPAGAPLLQKSLDAAEGVRRAESKIDATNSLATDAPERKAAIVEYLKAGRKQLENTKQIADDYIKWAEKNETYLPVEPRVSFSALEFAIIVFFLVVGIQLLIRFIPARVTQKQKIMIILALPLLVIVALACKIGIDRYEIAQEETRIQKEQEENARRAKEKREARERVKAERIAAEKRAEEERKASERRAAEEKERIRREQEEAVRKAAEEKAAKEKAEAERKAAEERERVRKEQEEIERKAAEARAEAERKEAVRKAAEEQERIRKEEEEAERKAAAERERIRKEQEEAERKAAIEREASERKAAAERAAKEKLAAEFAKKLKLPHRVASLDLEMQPIPTGIFLMGTPQDEANRFSLWGAAHQHRVTLTKPFWLGKYPVTQEQWEKLMGYNLSHFKDVGKDAPVENVSWTDAMDFCKKLTEQERAAGRLPDGYEYTLPTESEWEWACRAGTATAFNTGSNLTTAQANYSTDGYYYQGQEVKEGWRFKTTKVGIFSPNAWGLYDMHGNVWEWCSDWYGNYPSKDVTDPTGAAPVNTGNGWSYGRDTRVMRGGSWKTGASSCRSASRNSDEPGHRGNTLGFRIALKPVR